MAFDKVTETLIDALKQALAEPGDQRLYRSGKLAGLFPSRAGRAGDAAARALREGLLDLTRSETKGKTTIEWARITPRGVNFLHDHESPLQALQELNALLQITRTGLPGWLVQLQDQVGALGVHLADDVQRLAHRLDALSQRVEEALRRADAAAPALHDRLTSSVPWALDVLTYLERRPTGPDAGHCPLPELFAAIREKHADLSVAVFHDGLRRLHDHRALELLPFDGATQLIPEPEYALPDGTGVLYYARR